MITRPNVRNEKGVALPLVLIVMIVTMLLGTALWQYSMTDITHVSKEEKKMQAYYLARSGAELIADLKGEGTYTITENTPYNFTFDGHVINVVVGNDNGNDIITSTVTIGGITETLILNILNDVEYWESE